MTTTTKTTNPPKISAFEGNYYKRVDGGVPFEVACCLCGKRVKADAEGKIAHVYLTSMSLVALPGMERSEDDLMFYPVGSSCARKHKLKKLGAEIERL